MNCLGASYEVSYKELRPAAALISSGGRHKVPTPRSRSRRRPRREEDDNDENAKQSFEELDLEFYSKSRFNTPILGSETKKFLGYLRASPGVVYQRFFDGTKKGRLL